MELITAHNSKKNDLEEANGILVPMGIGDKGVCENVLMNAQDMRHVMVTGTLGSGRVDFLRSAITNILLSYTPAQVKLWLCDGGTLGLDIFEAKESPFFAYTSFEGSPDAIRAFVSALSAEVDLRSDLLAEANQSLRNNFKINTAAPGRLIAVMDINDKNIKALFGDSMFCEQFSNLIIRATAVGVHFILSAYGYNSMSCLPAVISDLFDVQVGMLQSPSQWYPNSVNQGFISHLQEIRRMKAVVNIPTPHTVKAIYYSSEKIIDVLTGIS